ncbi:MAG: toll/interleukin-1 receptor domain-containing protein [Vicinamibacterales bacterium]
MHVFVSYSSADRQTADDLVARLERDGLTCWYAPRDIRPGVEYATAILDAIQVSHVVVVIVSGRAVASQQVLREVERAVHYRIRLLPFRIENVPLRGSFELFLSTSHWLDAYAGSRHHHLDCLAAAVSSIVNPTAQTTNAAERLETPRPSPAPSVQPMSELSPDSWSQRPGGRFRRFLTNFLEDSE